MERAIIVLWMMMIPTTLAFHSPFVGSTTRLQLSYTNQNSKHPKWRIKASPSKLVLSFRKINNNEDSPNAAEVAVNATTSSTSSKYVEEALERLRHENYLLKTQVHLLKEENDFLSQQQYTTEDIVIETFEGETRNNRWFQYDENGDVGDDTATARKMQQIQIVDNDDECNDDNSCPIEPNISFKDALRDRAYWLVGLLVLQSCSGFILVRNEALLQNHPVIIYFLTMLVGAGGNAGNQASVRVIRGLALGTLNEKTQAQFLSREFKMAIALSIILSFAGFFRATIFNTPPAEALALTTALSIIVFISVCLGAVLPLLLKRINVDPAHSSTSIQVIMDILGVILTVFISGFLLDSPAGRFLVEKLI